MWLVRCEVRTLPQTGFEVERSLDDLPHVAGLVRGELPPCGEDPAGGGEVLEGLVGLEETEVGVVESVHRQLLGALVVGYDQDQVGCTRETRRRHSSESVVGHDQDQVGDT